MLYQQVQNVIWSDRGPHLMKSGALNCRRVSAASPVSSLQKTSGQPP